jgi:hypothetical protein
MTMGRAATGVMATLPRFVLLESYEWTQSLHGTCVKEWWTPGYERLRHGVMVFFGVRLVWHRYSLEQLVRPTRRCMNERTDTSIFKMALRVILL